MFTLSAYERLEPSSFTKAPHVPAISLASLGATEPSSTPDEEAIDNQMILRVCIPMWPCQRRSILTNRFLGSDVVQAHLQSLFGSVSHSVASYRVNYDRFSLIIPLGAPSPPAYKAPRNDLGPHLVADRRAKEKLCLPLHDQGPEWYERSWGRRECVRAPWLRRERRGILEVGGSDRVLYMHPRICKSRREVDRCRHIGLIGSSASRCVCLQDRAPLGRRPSGRVHAVALHS
jgi:hypothetical protein